MTRPVVAAHHWSFYDLAVADTCEHTLQLGYPALDLAVGDLGSGPRLVLEDLAADPAACARVGAWGEASGVAFTDSCTRSCTFPA